MSCPYDNKPCKVPYVKKMIVSWGTQKKDYIGDKVGCMICSNHKIVRELSILRATK